MNAVNIFSKKTTWFVILVLLLAAGGGYYYYYQLQQQAVIAAQKAAAYQTSPVTLGTISLGATGTGKVYSNTLQDLDFSVPGTVALLNVKIGQTVKSGDTLAALDNINELKTAVLTAQLNLQQAQQNLADLLAYPDKNIAQAVSDLSAAQSTYAWAKYHEMTKSQQRCSDDLTLKYFYATLHDQHYVNYFNDMLANHPQGAYQFLMNNLNYSQSVLNRDTANYTWCQGYSQDEILASQASFKIADATLQQAEVALQQIKAENGVDPNALALAKAKITNAELQLTTAESNLAGATLVAPFNGTVLAVAGNLGDTIGSGRTTGPVGIASTTISQGSLSSASLIAGQTAFITVADLTHPLIDASFDQTDYQSFDAGCSANVTFDALPGKTFPGKLTQVLPALATTSGFQSIKGVVELDTSTQTLTSPLSLGMSATVDVICQQAKNVLMAPVEALKNVNGNQADVYILSSAGEPVKQHVTTGLSNGIFIEISSGLRSGQQVITKGAPAQ